MSTSVKARTARRPHRCEECCSRFGWQVGVPTILPGHRYLHHTAFPGTEINTGDSPFSLDECADCAARRHQIYGNERLDSLTACLTGCCGDVVCALPHGHEGVHSCRRCAAEKADAR